MIDLTNKEEIKKLDPKDVYGSTGMFVDQCKQIWADAKSIVFPESYKNPQNIIQGGMGGSAYGGYVARALYKDTMKAPLISNNDYTVPGYVNNKSVVLLTSYSGSTEESLTAGTAAKTKGALLTGLTGGGKLGDMLKAENAPALIFQSKFNPSGQPRLGTGYMVLGVIALLNQLGVISVSDEEAQKAISEVEADSENITQKAMDMAKALQGYIPVLFAGEFLNGNIHIMRNQFNETAKSFSAFSELPELNHHLMEGLKNPSDKKLKVIFFESSFYSDKLKKRVVLTKDVVTQNTIEYVSYEPAGTSTLSQALNTLSFGGYVTLYLALLYGQDPSVIPWVDYFKAKLT